MYTIGQFSVISKLNKKTLRYYDEIDLFKPAYIDPTNNYRYYQREQIKDIKEIVRLKEIGLPLEQIKTVMISTAEDYFLTIYNDRLKEIESSLNQLNTQKKMIETYLNHSAEKNLLETDYKITKGYYIPEGKVLFNTVDSSNENIDIHTIINNFYSNMNGCSLLESGHILKRNSNNDTSNIIEIFAYVEDRCAGETVRLQSKEQCLKISCTGIENRDYAYANLFDYIKNNELNIGSIYEKYSFKQGKMCIDIMFELL